MARRGEGAKAIAALEKIQVEDPRRMSLLLRCHGDVRAVLGEKKQALVFYRRAMALPGLPRRVAESIQKTIEALESPAAVRPEPARQ
jgi:hypothetical protein